MKQFILQSATVCNGTAEITKDDYCHLVSVLRKRKGSRINVRFAGGEVSEAVITEIDTVKKRAVLTFENTKNTNDTLKTPVIILLQWLIKSNKMDLVVRQAAEAGIRYILPVQGEFSVVHHESDTQTERRKRIIREALQQSGSNVNTEIFQPMALKKALAQLAELTGSVSSVKLRFSEIDEAAGSLYEYLTCKPEITAIAIGAEGGISFQEAELLSAEGFKTVHFKTNILRAETAAIYAIGAVQTALTEAEKWRLNE